MTDYIVVGAGLSGAAVARHLAEKGKHVTIWDRRQHIGGNMYDYHDEYGILVQQYGPHIFHTKNKEVYDYFCRFVQMKPYQLTYMACIDGKFTPTPFNYQTIDDFYPADKATELKKNIEKTFPGRKSATVVEVLQSDDSLVRSYGEFLFAKDYSLYTAKQWGIAPEKVDPSILKRVPLVFGYERDYFADPWQAMPETSFTDFFKALLNHPNIEVKLGVEALQHLRISDDGTRLLLDGIPCPVPVVYTGALDELFNADEGPLPYRSLRFEWHHEDKTSHQEAAVTAYPQAAEYTRITEYNKLPIQVNTNGTTYAVEYPLQYQPGTRQEPYYPLLTENSQAAADHYKERAEKIDKFYFCGRLADFKYYNMDQALIRAWELCQQIDK